MMRSTRIDDGISGRELGHYRHLALRCLGFLARMIDRHRQRSGLAELSDQQLADIGVSREEAMAEAAKPCWR